MNFQSLTRCDSILIVHFTTGRVDSLFEIIFCSGRFRAWLSGWFGCWFFWWFWFGFRFGFGLNFNQIVFKLYHVGYCLTFRRIFRCKVTTYPKSKPLNPKAPSPAESLLVNTLIRWLNEPVVTLYAKITTGRRIPSKYYHNDDFSRNLMNISKSECFSG